MDPLTALTSILYFVVVVIVQHQKLARLAFRQGEKIVAHRDALYRVLTDAAQLRRTLSRTSADSIITFLSRYRSSLSDVRGRASFTYMVPRYLLELTLAIGILLMGSVAYLTSGTPDALAAVVVFTGVSFRLLPAINRIQVLALTIINDLPTAK